MSFVSSGSKLFDLALGGGWAERRVVNVIGDKSTGKTLVAIDAARNFAVKHQKGRILYREAEAALDRAYAEGLGLPKRTEMRDDIETVEDLFEDLQEVAKTTKAPTLYVLDSLDALSDRSEMLRELDEGTYGAGKAKQLSQTFRRTINQLYEAKVTLMIISQIRDKIGVTFGRKFSRSGGRSLDFYASQIVLLSEIGKLKRTMSGITRPIGVEIRAKIDKNKAGNPFREADFSIIFGYGIDDTQECLDFLAECDSLEDMLKLTKEQVKHGQGSQSRYVQRLNELPTDKYMEELARIHEATERKWLEVEQGFAPKRRKYEEEL